MSDLHSQFLSLFTSCWADTFTYMMSSCHVKASHFDKGLVGHPAYKVPLHTGTDLWKNFRFWRSSKCHFDWIFFWIFAAFLLLSIEFRLHFDWILAAFTDCILAAFWLHFDCFWLNFYAFLLYFVCFRLKFGWILAAFLLNSCWILAASWLLLNEMEFFSHEPDQCALYGIKNTAAAFHEFRANKERTQKWACLWLMENFEQKNMGLLRNRGS